MRKIIQIGLCLAIVVIITGCGNGDGSSVSIKKDNKSEVEKALEAGMNGATQGPDATESGGNTGKRKSGVSENAHTPEPIDIEEEKKASDGNIDVDLTRLSSNMVYSEVYNMMMSPGDYRGKKIKMRGAFTYYKEEETGNEFFACVIKDATECCSQGLEFVLKGEHKYPDDYPKDGEEVTVVGTYETYEDQGATYCRLVDSKIV